MSRLTPARALTLASLAVLAMSLAGCGKTGELERPAPLFGKGGAPAKDTDKPTREAQDPSRPVKTVDPRNQTLDPAPSRTVPIQGQSPDPMAPGPQGVLPDPYANPQ
jgi:predicted small lipoprotein YifL